MLNVLDLFAGIGGFSLGLERTGGFRTAAFCEIDKKAQLVLKKHWPDTPIFEDVSALTKDLIDATVGVPVDVITGGFPCQDISLAGKGAGLAGERSGLWFQFHRLIEEIRPRYAIVENVSALRSRGLEVVLGGLAEIGYDAEWHCIPAAAVGAPHRRDRIWIVAYPEGEGRTGGGSGGGYSPDGEILDVFSSDSSAVVANANGARSYASALSRVCGEEAGAGPRDGEPERRCGAQGQGSLASVPAGKDDVADALRSRRTAGLPASGHGQEGYSKIADHLGDRLRGWAGSDYWAVEPDVGRVAHGVPNRVDRLKQLGNAVVPQIPQLLGEAILDWEKTRVAA